MENNDVMPYATATWLIDNTSLTFQQIADFCSLHILEVKAIADGTMAKNIIAKNPIENYRLTEEEIKRCEADSTLRLEANKLNISVSLSKKKKKRYTPIAQRKNKPDAIAWFIRFAPELSDSQVIKLIGTTKSTIENIKNKTHRNMENITPKDPIILGLCTQMEINKEIAKAKSIAEKAEKQKTDTV